jgi:hypothetical protein
MLIGLAILSGLTGLLWVPLALRFRREWKAFRDPTAIAVAGVLLLLIYQEIMFTLTATDLVSWSFYGIATRAIAPVVAINVYLAFRWSDKKKRAVQANGAHLTVM